MTYFEISIASIAWLMMSLMYLLYRYFSGVIQETHEGIECRINRLVDLWNEVQATWLKKEKMHVSCEGIKKEIACHELELHKLRDEIQNNYLCCTTGMESVQHLISDLDSTILYSTNGLIDRITALEKKEQRQKEKSHATNRPTTKKVLPAYNTTPRSSKAKSGS